MAYDATKPPRQAMQLSIDAGSLWMYDSPDPHATVEGAAYFSNGGKIGMRVGDILICRQVSNGATTIHSVTVVAAAAASSSDKTPGAATISAAQFT